MTVINCVIDAFYEEMGTVVKGNKIEIVDLVNTVLETEVSHKIVDYGFFHLFIVLLKINLTFL